MSEWEMTTVGEVAEIFDGPHATPAKTESGPWFLSISSLKQGQLDLSQSAHLSDEDFRKWTRRVTPQEGDVLFSYETRLGEAALMPAEIQACLGRRMGLLRPRANRADSRFLLYAYLGPEFQRVIHERSIHGATVDRIPLVELPGWPIRLPEIWEQKAIAELLGALDDKIAANDRISSILNSLITAHYVAKSKVAKLEVKLGELIELKYGKALIEEGRTPGSVPVFGGNGISGWHNVSLNDGPGVIVGRKGANAGSVSWSQGPFWPIDTSFYVEPRSESTPLEFLYLLLEDAGLRNLVGDSAIPGLNREIALSLTVRLPPEETIQLFAETARPLLALNAQISEESRSIAELRDTLLPKLMSGKIRVRDAARVVEDVT
jgi:type I restriction enzyme, S subunit